MRKPIQQIIAWRFPCDGPQFRFKDNGILEIGILPPTKTKKLFFNQLKDGNGGYCDCECGRQCKPEKIVITVERA